MDPGFVTATGKSVLRHGLAEKLRRRRTRSSAMAHGEHLSLDRLVFLLPALILLGLLIYVPMLISGYISFTGLNEYTIGSWLHAPFVGGANYASALKPGGPIGAEFLQSIRGSVLFATLSTAIAGPVGVGAALLLNSKVHGRRILRVVLLVPYVIPGYVTGIVWNLMFQNRWGLVDRVLRLLHLSNGNTYWLLGPHSLWALVIADSWSAWPFIYMMTLAGLQLIPAEMHEAATIDGAGAARRFTAVTVPLLWPSLSLALLFSTLNHLNNFTLPYVMFGSNPPAAATVMPVAIYTQSFNLFNFGLGAAMSLVSLAVMLVPAVFYMRASGLNEVGNAA